LDSILPDTALSQPQSSDNNSAAFYQEFPGRRRNHSRMGLPAGLNGWKELPTAFSAMPDKEKRKEK